MRGVAPGGQARARKSDTLLNGNDVGLRERGRDYFLAGLFAVVRFELSSLLGLAVRVGWLWVGHIRDEYMNWKTGLALGFGIWVGIGFGFNVMMYDRYPPFYSEDSL
jgi:hypothetical protein